MSLRSLLGALKCFFRHAVFFLLEFGASSDFGDALPGPFKVEGRNLPFPRFVPTLGAPSVLMTSFGSMSAYWPY